MQEYRNVDFVIIHQDWLADILSYLIVNRYQIPISKQHKRRMAFTAYLNFRKKIRNRGIAEKQARETMRRLLKNLIESGDL